MAAVGDDGVDYETDPEESNRSLIGPRKHASDDDEGVEERESEGPPTRAGSRDRIDLGAEFEGQGGPDEYEDDAGDESEEYDEFEEEEEREEEREGGRLDGGDVVEVVNEGSGSVGELGEAEVGEEGVKKENEPFAVPTAGAFYMHDDRFRDNAHGRNRRMFGGRKLWESQNETKWGHDKFEEITVQERHYNNEGTRNSRGRYRGRGKIKNQGGDRGNPRGEKSKEYDTYNQNQPPKIKKGRGFRKYDSLKRNKNEAPPMQYRQRSSKAVENPPHAASGRAPVSSTNLESGPVSSTKQAFASSLNSASPPFYPSGSSSKETAWVQKRDVPPPGNINRNSRSADVDENISVSQPSVTRGRNGVDTVGMNKLYVSNNSVSQNSGKISSGSPMVSTAHPRAQGRAVASSGQMAYQPVVPHSQVMRASTPSNFHHKSSPQLRQFSASGSQISNNSRAASNLNNFEYGESDFPPDSNKFKSALVAKEKGGVQDGGKGSFMYGGSQVMALPGNMSHGDQNFATAPFLPVMPFGGQHPGGMGVPAMGMAFPGYVAQPNGSGKTEMTWLPVLAGAAGALGSAYGSPYISLESTYHHRPSGQTLSSGASSKDSNTNISNDEWKPSQIPEVMKDEVGQRQKSRRYTEMKFGQ